MRNQNLTKLAELILRQQDGLMLLWRSKVQQVPAVQNLDTQSAGGHIAALLEDVAAALLKGKKKSLITLPVDGTTEVHAVQRFQEGFDLIEVVADYNALREAIQEFAEANHISVTGRVRSILDRVLDKAIGVAVQTYSEQKALEIQRQREEHLSFIVHDLKTPLAAVSTATKILERLLSGDCKNERVATMLQIVERNAERLNGLISRVIQEQIVTQRTAAESVFPAKVQKRHFDLWPLIEQLTHDLQPLTEPKRIRIKNEVPHDCSIFADPVLVVQVFQNLLSNAIKYTTDGEITIGSLVSERSRSCRCWVQDTGDGIAEDRLAKVFDKLETDPQGGGSGLGLAIVKQVIEAHGGFITATSKPGQGATFEFSLPLQGAAIAPDQRGNGTAA
jgi:two-component system, OmpR family, phosphate regulon sensor histidine kinase PhoR